MEKDHQKLSPAEQLKQQLEAPFKQFDQVAQLNNDAVRLFAEGRISTSDLINVSLRLAARTDHMANKVLTTDPSKAEKPENKPLIYSTLLSVAQENRTRVVTLTLEQQRQAQSKAQMQDRSGLMQQRVNLPDIIAHHACPSEYSIWSPLKAEPKLDMLSDP